MKYSAPIPKPESDLKYSGGDLFRKITKSSYTRSYDGAIIDHPGIWFGINEYCYLTRYENMADHRAFILIDGYSYNSHTDIRFILVGGGGGLLEVKLTHDQLLLVRSMLHPYYFGQQLYRELHQRLVAYAAGVGWDNFQQQPINDARGQVIYAEQLDDYLRYLLKQAYIGAQEAGCKNRSIEALHLFEQHLRKVSSNQWVAKLNCLTKDSHYTNNLKEYLFSDPLPEDLEEAALTIIKVAGREGFYLGGLDVGNWTPDIYRALAGTFNQILKRLKGEIE